MRAIPLRVAVIGAGPYGLAVTAHLRHAGLDVTIYGRTMEFWERQMPRGMLLRSSKRASHISDPQRRLTLDTWGRDTGRELAGPIPVEDFIAYGRWFQTRVAPDLDERRVTEVEPDEDDFRLTLHDGTEERFHRVVVSAGLNPFPRWPEEFRSLPTSMVTHACEHEDLSRFSGQRVAVIGLGQSALESAALLNEGGATVEVIGRSDAINWLPNPPMGLRRFRQRFYPPTDVGGLLNGWLAAVPDLFRRAPAGKQPIWAYNAIRPAGAYWLRPRLLHRVQVSTARSVVAAEANGHGLRIGLDDGSERIVDHALLATGYQIDVARYPFLRASALRRLKRTSGYPVLGPGLESSVPGLHFIGATAATSFGPVMRFVVGAHYAAPAVVRKVLQRPQRLLSPAF